MSDLKKGLNRRALLLFVILAAIIYLSVIFIWGSSMDEAEYAVNYDNKFISPCAEHPFGTDFMGRDMLSRSIKGLSVSLRIGILAAAVSSVIALILGCASAIFGGWVDKLVNLLVDLCMGLPHLVLMILISVLLGKGIRGVTAAMALTHWPALTRIVRAEVMQIRSSGYVQAAYRMGRSRLSVAFSHIVPNIAPTYFIGLLLLFPHAIMHEAAISFLGFGLPAELPAIGVILSEAMNHIVTGKWWLALFPGLMLLSVILFFDALGENIRKLLNPGSGNE